MDIRDKFYETVRDRVLDGSNRVKAGWVKGESRTGKKGLQHFVWREFDFKPNTSETKPIQSSHGRFNTLNFCFQPNTSETVIRIFVHNNIHKDIPLCGRVRDSLSTIKQNSKSELERLGFSISSCVNTLCDKKVKLTSWDDLETAKTVADNLISVMEIVSRYM